MLNTIEQSLLDKISSIGEAKAIDEATQTDEPEEAPASRADSSGLILPARWVQERATAAAAAKAQASAAAAAASSAVTATKRKSSQAPEAMPPAKRPPRQWRGLDPALTEHLGNDSATEDSPSPPSIHELSFFDNSRVAPHAHLRDLQPTYDDFEPHAFDEARTAEAVSGAGAAADDPLFFITSSSSSESSFGRWRAPAARSRADDSPAASPLSTHSRAESAEMDSRSSSPEQPLAVQHVASPACPPVVAMPGQPAPPRPEVRSDEGAPVARPSLAMPVRAPATPSAPQPNLPAAVDSAAGEAEAEDDDDDFEAFFEEHTL